MCISYESISKYKFDLIFNILDHICTTCFVFANSFGKSFQSLLQIVKGIWIRLQEAFSRFEISPLFQMLFLWLNKTPPGWNSSLSFQEGFNRYQLKLILGMLLKMYQLKINIPIWNILTKNFHHKIPIEKTNINYQFENFWSLVVRSFCFGLNISPPLPLIAKNRDFVSPFYFLPHW